MVLDCRPASQLFKPPPGVTLATAENVSTVEVDPEDTFYFSQSYAKAKANLLGAKPRL